jgi:hypothetical protein
MVTDINKVKKEIRYCIGNKNTLILTIKTKELSFCYDSMVHSPVQKRERGYTGGGGVIPL